MPVACPFAVFLAMITFLVWAVLIAAGIKFYLDWRADQREEAGAWNDPNRPNGARDDLASLHRKDSDR